MFPRYNKRKDELFIFDDQTGNSTATAAAGAGSNTRQAEDKLRQGQEMVMFPGVNAPAPPGADARLWVGTHGSLSCLFAWVSSFVMQTHQNTGRRNQDSLAVDAQPCPAVAHVIRDI